MANTNSTIKFLRGDLAKLNGKLDYGQPFFDLASGQLYIGNNNNVPVAITNVNLQNQINVLGSDINTLDGNVVKLTGNQTISGTKTFNNTISGTIDEANSTLISGTYYKYRVVEDDSDSGKIDYITFII